MLHNKNKKIAFYKKIKGKNSIVYNGSLFDTIDNSLLNDMFKKPYDHEYILVPHVGKDIENDYKKYIINIEKIKLLTNDKINMYKTGTYSNTALCLFNDMNKITAEKIQDFEIPFLNNGGGVRFAKPYQGKAFKYDICSYYPSIMNSKKLKIPINEGILTTISTEDINKFKTLKYGIYNVKIECNEKIKFTLQNSNMYSHIEVNYAKKLKLKIEVLGQHLLYLQKDLISCNSVFSEFVKYLFDLKLKDKAFKNILNCLWGSIVAKSGGIRKTIISYTDIDPTKYDIIKMTPIDSDTCEILIKYPVLFYRNNFARLNAFLLGYARVNMHKTFELIGYENIVFSHTDSMITSKRIDFNRIPFGNGSLGKWNYEGASNNCIINNMNKYKFN
jgi:hypothetical protein